MDEHRSRNGLEAKSAAKRQKGSKRRRSSTAAVWSGDVETSKVPRFDSPSKLKIKFVVQSAKSDGKVSTIVRNLNEETSPKRPEASSPTPNFASPTSQFTSPDKLKMKISMGSRSVTFNNDDTTSSDALTAIKGPAVENVVTSDDAVDAQQVAESSSSVDFDVGGKKKASRAPEFIADRSSRVKSYFRRRHAPFKRTFDLVLSFSLRVEQCPLQTSRL